MLKRPSRQRFSSRLQVAKQQARWGRKLSHGGVASVQVLVSRQPESSTSQIRAHRGRQSRCLFGRENGYDSATLFHGRSLNFGNLSQLLDDAVDHSTPFVHVGQLSTTENDRDDHLIFVL